MFDTTKATIDTSVYDRPRICKLAGTPARKGVDTSARPHRWSSVLSEAKGLNPVSLEILLELANLPEMPKAIEQVQADSQDIRNGMDWIERFLEWGGFEHSNEKPHEGGIIVPFVSDCPFDHESGHHTNECHAGVNREGKYCFKCQHNSCRRRGWKEFRARVEEIMGEPYIGDPVIFASKTEIPPSNPVAIETETETAETETETEADTKTKPKQETAVTESCEGEIHFRDLLQGEMVVNERSASDMFNSLFGSDYRYAIIRKEGEWMRWNGRTWVVTTSGKMLERVKALSREIRQEVLPTIEKEAERNVLKGLANKLDTVRFIQNAFRFLEGDREIQFTNFDKRRVFSTSRMALSI
jgi:hypothetical protein